MFEASESDEYFLHILALPSPVTMIVSSGLVSARRAAASARTRVRGDAVPSLLMPAPRTIAIDEPRGPILLFTANSSGWNLARRQLAILTSSQSKSALLSQRQKKEGFSGEYCGVGRVGDVQMVNIFDLSSSEP